MSINSERVKKWRRTNKRRLIDSLGGKCCICGYNNCDEALEFHHLNPDEKEFTFSKFRGNIKGWATLVKEIRKCVVLCSNCHKEVHSVTSDVKVPSDAARFNEDFADYRMKEKRELGLIDNCPVCGNEKPHSRKTCSKQCGGKIAGKVDWIQHNACALVEKHGSYEAVGELLGVTGAAISRRIKKETTGKY
jgi:predicted molibdopterin-dependent oxidoreductase YjgC